MLDYRRFRDINEFFASGQPQKARRLLMEMQSRFIALRDEISLLRLRLQTAEDALQLSRNLYLDGDLYWLKSDPEPAGPFCPACYEAEGALIFLDRLKCELVCPYCHTSYPLRNARSPEGGIVHARILHFIP